MDAVVPKIDKLIDNKNVEDWAKVSNNEGITVEGLTGRIDIFGARYQKAV